MGAWCGEKFSSTCGQLVVQSSRQGESGMRRGRSVNRLVWWVLSRQHAAVASFREQSVPPLQPLYLS